MNCFGHPMDGLFSNLHQNIVLLGENVYLMKIIYVIFWRLTDNDLDVFLQLTDVKNNT